MMPFDPTAVLVPIISVVVVFTFLTIIIVTNSFNRRREREQIIETARLSVEKGQPLPPEVIASLTAERRHTAFSDLRRGVVLIAVGIGIGVFGIFVGASELYGIGAIPGLIGVALVVLSRFNPNKD